MPARLNSHCRSRPWFDPPVPLSLLPIASMSVTTFFKLSVRYLTCADVACCRRGVSRVERASCLQCPALPEKRASSLQDRATDRARSPPHKCRPARVICCHHVRDHKRGAGAAHTHPQSPKRHEGQPSLVVCVRHLSLSYTEQKFAGHHSIVSLPVKLDANAGRHNRRAEPLTETFRQRRQRNLSRSL